MSGKSKFIPNPLGLGVSRKSQYIENLPVGSIVVTSSGRNKVQIVERVHTVLTPELAGDIQGFGVRTQELGQRKIQNKRMMKHFQDIKDGKENSIVIFVGILKNGKKTILNKEDLKKVMTNRQLAQCERYLNDGQHRIAAYLKAISEGFEGRVDLTIHIMLMEDEDSLRGWTNTFDSRKWVRSPSNVATVALGLKYCEGRGKTINICNTAISNLDACCGGNFANLENCNPSFSRDVDIVEHENYVNLAAKSDDIVKFVAAMRQSEFDTASLDAGVTTCMLKTFIIAKQKSPQEVVRITEIWSRYLENYRGIEFSEFRVLYARFHDPAKKSEKSGGCSQSNQLKSYNMAAAAFYMAYNGPQVNVQQYRPGCLYDPFKGLISPK